MKNKDSNFAVALKGETITEIAGLEVGKDEVIFKTKSGRVFKMYHDQDCCETVQIVRCNKVYLGSDGIEVMDATEKIESDVPAEESATRTTFVINDTSYSKIIIEWLGESNGHYSESVSFVECFAEPDTSSVQS